VAELAEERKRLDDAQGLTHVGLELYHQMRYEVAIPYFTQANELCPNFFDPYPRKGICFHLLGNNEKAIVCYDIAIKLKIGVPLLYDLKGLSLHHLKRYGEAIDCFDKAIELDTQNAYSYGAKSACLIELNRYEEALLFADKAIELDPSNQFSHSSRGLALQNLQRYDDAIRSYDQGLAINSTNYVLLSNKGITLQSINCFEDFTRVIELNPQDSPAFCGRCYALSARSRFRDRDMPFDISADSKRH
jgi:tetratricopeptide (TPR) repeat protein